MIAAPESVPIFIEDALLDGAGMRRAALLVHAMVPADQSFILQALPAQQAAGLRTLVDELETLGIARDPALIATATGVRSDSNGETRSRSTSDLGLERADATQFAAVVSHLNAEPAAVAAYFLQMANRSSRERLLAELDPTQRRRVDAFLEAHAPLLIPPALRTALLAAFRVSMNGARGTSRSEVDAPTLRRFLTRTLSKFGHGRQIRSGARP